MRPGTLARESGPTMSSSGMPSSSQMAMVASALSTLKRPGMESTQLPSQLGVWATNCT